MENLSLESRNQLGQLFARRMPAKLRQCARLLCDGANQHWPAPITEQLEQQVDRLQRACANFGFAHLETLMAEVTSLLEEAITDALEPPFETVNSVAEQLLSVASAQDGMVHHQRSTDFAFSPAATTLEATPTLAQAAADTETARHGADTSATLVDENAPDSVAIAADLKQLQRLCPTPDRPVLLALDATEGGTCAEILHLFGYQTQQLAAQAWPVLQGHIEQHCEQQNPLAAILPLPESSTVAKILARIAVDYSIPFLFYADVDSLDNRLMAVRSGGRDFILSPLDVQDIILRLDRIATPLHDEPLRILVVEDSRSQGVFCVRTLKKVGMEPLLVAEPSKLLGSVKTFEPELILMDMQLPGCNGIELAQILQQHADTATVPIIYVSAEDDEAKRAQALATAGEGFLSKPVQQVPLVNAVRHRAARYRATRSLRDCDSLTGLSNRQSFMRELETSASRAARDAVGFTLTLMEINDLDALRRESGEAAAERATLALGNLLRQRLRRSDRTARLRDGLFGAIFYDCPETNARSIVSAIEQIWGQLSQSMLHSVPLKLIWSLEVLTSQEAPALYREVLRKLHEKRQ